MPLYYVVLNADDSIGKQVQQLIPPPGFSGELFVLAVEAENEHDARAFVQDSFKPLAAEKDFGELEVAQKSKHGWILQLPGVHKG